VSSCSCGRWHYVLTRRQWPGRPRRCPRLCTIRQSAAAAEDAASASADDCCRWIHWHWTVCKCCGTLMHPPPPSGTRGMDAWAEEHG
jgi:hypothetical protein